jgi:hypothetical protein
MTGPACGNNPHHKLSDGDRQAVENFKAYLADRATRRKQYGDVIRRWGLLDEVNDPKATEDFVITDLLSLVDAEQAAEVTRLRGELAKALERNAAERCADRTAVLREAADAAEQEFIHGVVPAASERDEIWDQAVRAVATLLRGMADETQPAETQPRGRVTFEMLAGVLAAHTDLLTAALGNDTASVAAVPTEIAGMRRVIDLLKLHKSRLLNLQQHAGLIRTLGPFLAALTAEPAAGARQDGAQQ